MNRYSSIFFAVAFGAASITAHAANEAYKEARKTADATYKMDREGCKGFSGKEHDDCMRTAKVKHEQAISEAHKLKTHGAAWHGDASQTEQSYSKLPASGAASASQPRTAGNQPGEHMGNAPVTAGDGSSVR